MGWAVGWDSEKRRWIGYGVPAVCEHPDCDEEIDRGLAYRCGDLSDDGCNMFFCENHLAYAYDAEQNELSDWALCERCIWNLEHEDDWVQTFPLKPDTREWAEHVLTDSSWEQWRREEPAQVAQMQAILGEK
jgi:hypothetical protein